MRVGVWHFNFSTTRYQLGGHFFLEQMMINNVVFYISNCSKVKYDYVPYLDSELPQNFLSLSLRDNKTDVGTCI